MSTQLVHTVMGSSYTTKLKNMMKDLLSSGHLSDVTLVCDDKVMLKAHKFILNSYSPVLRNILSDEDTPASVIYLRGIHHQEMSAILQFMYLGQSRFIQERLPLFFKVCQDLEIKEVQNMFNNVTPTNTIQPKQVVPVPPDIPTLAPHHPPIIAPAFTSPITSALPPIPPQQVPTFPTSSTPSAPSTIPTLPTLPSMTELIPTVEHEQEVNKKLLVDCPHCGTVFEDFEELNNHIKSVHTLYECKYCEFKSKYKTDIKIHLKKKHAKHSLAMSKPVKQKTPEPEVEKESELKEEQPNFDFNDENPINIELNKSISNEEDMIFPMDEDQTREETPEQDSQVAIEPSSSMKMKCKFCDFMSSSVNEITLHITGTHQNELISTPAKLMYKSKTKRSKQSLKLKHPISKKVLNSPY